MQRLRFQGRDADAGRTNEPARSAPDYDHFIARNQHGLYCIPRDFAHREVPRVLAAGHVYEPRTLICLAGLYQGGDIVSGGAFVGDFLPFLSRVTRDDGRVISFEPHPITIQATWHTLALNDLDNVDLAQVAVSDMTGSLPLRVTRPGGNPLAAAARLVEDVSGTDRDDNLTQVEVLPLDDLLELTRPVSLLHLDIEGHEERALRGAAETIRRWAPAIVLELSDRRRAARIIGYTRLLEEIAPDANYELTQILEDEGNGVFLPKGRRQF